MAQVIVYENGNAIGGEGHPTNASDITFDNTGTDLVSEEVESAIKEVNAKSAKSADLTSISESGATASQAISNGKYFYLSGTLCRAITDIASGATFTLNTNYKAITEGALNKLRIIPQIVNGTADTSGNIAIDANINHIYVSFVSASGSTDCLFTLFRSTNGSTYIHCSAFVDGSRVTSAIVKGIAYYIDLS